MPRPWTGRLRNLYAEASGGFRWSASVTVDDVPRLTRAVVAAASSLLIGTLFGWEGAATAVLLGTWAVVYGEASTPGTRWRTVGGYGAVLCGATLCGVLVGTIIADLNYAAASTVFVLTMALAAGSIAAVVKLAQSSPPGSFLIVLVFELVVALVAHGASPGRLLAAGALGCAAAVVSAVMVDAALSRSRRWAVVGPRTGGWPVVALDLRRRAIGLVRTGPRAILARHVWVQLTLAALVAGAIAAAVGLPRPDWAVMSAAMVLHQGPARGIGTVRGLHRFVGTVLGCGVFLMLGWLHLPWQAILVVVALFFAFGDLFLSRHYGMAMVFLTPTIIIVGSQGMPDAVGQAAGTRVAETTIGVVVAIAILLVGRVKLPGQLHMRWR